MRILKTLRGEKKLNQQQLASLLNVSRSTVAMWETDSAEPNIELLIKIAEIFDVSLDYLLGRTDINSTQDDIMFQIRLKELRESHNLSQYELADKLGVKQSTVAMWENGTNKPRHTTLIKIARFFNVPLDYISGETNATPPAPTSSFESHLSTIDFLLSKETKGLSDADKQDVLNFIQYKKFQKDTEEPTSPFQSSRVLTTESFEDDVERMAAFGGMEDDEGDEPLMT